MVNNPENFLSSELKVKRVLGKGVLLGGTITNSSAYPVKDIRFRCDFVGASGSRIKDTPGVITPLLMDDDIILYERVGANSTHTFKNLEIGYPDGQARGVDCRIKGAAITQ